MSIINNKKRYLLPKKPDNNNEDNKEEKHTLVQCATVKGMKHDCSACGAEFVALYNLVRHQKTAHAAWYRFNRCKGDGPAEMMAQRKHICDVCNKQFVRSFDVRRHKKNIHKIHTYNSDRNFLKQGEDRMTNFKCHFCDKHFSKNSALKRHLNNVHKVTTENKKQLKCSECKSSFTSRASFLSHIEKSHEIPFTLENLDFDNNEQFELWKTEIEKKTTSKYMKHTYKLSTGNQMVIFVCHRNGNYKSKSIGKRRIKIGGTKKIDYFCPSSILFKSKKPDKLFPASVTYCSLHLGHQCEIKRIPLRKDEKDRLAGQLLSGVPMHHILHDISEHASPTERLAITNMQDLRNISSSYGLSNHEWNTKLVKENREMREEISKLKKQLNIFIEEKDQENKIIIRDSKKIEIKIIDMEENMNEVKRETIENQQYGRANILVIDNVYKEHNEVCSDIIKNIGKLLETEIRDEDINITHRLGKLRSNRGRIIEVLQKKYKGKNTGKCKNKK